MNEKLFCILYIIHIFYVNMKINYKFFEILCILIVLCLSLSVFFVVSKNKTKLKFRIVCELNEYMYLCIYLYMLTTYHE